MVSHIFLIILNVNWFQQIPRDYKSFTIVGQHFFSLINAVLRKIHTPPENRGDAIYCFTAMFDDNDDVFFGGP